MDDRVRELIFSLIDQTISPEDFDRLQDLVERDESIREEYLRAVNLSETLGEIASRRGDENEASTVVSSQGTARFPLTQYAVAACLLLLASGAAYWIGTRSASRQSAQNTASMNSTENPPAAQGDRDEALIAGHATLRRSVDIRWANTVAPIRDGDVLPGGVLRFTEGVAEIDFFCGATLIVEGPAELNIESDWSVQVNEGRLRANVPPAARGFLIKAADSEIIDLGTEFALEVDADKARVEVIDGEIELRGGKHDGEHLLTGQRRWLLNSGGETESFEGLSTESDVQRRREDALTKRIAEWKQHVAELKTDPRLVAFFPIAFFPIASSPPEQSPLQDRVVVNAVSERDGLTPSDFNGVLVGPVEHTLGRFGRQSLGLKFDRPGSRVRTLIDRKFSAYTFACWVRIDSLEHRYNALFMSDGYENGELHWQIQDDGRLMFSVMVDDRPGTGHGRAPDARLHRLYFTDPIWDVSQSGRWMHVAAVYDPKARRVTQYLNGMSISEEAIEDEFHVTELRIGPAEIGNWGQPLRKTPWFAVRNLNGAIDELSIYDAALSAEEIETLYEKGKPLGY